MAFGYKVTFEELVNGEWKSQEILCESHNNAYKLAFNLRNYHGDTTRNINVKSFGSYFA